MGLSLNSAVIKFYFLSNSMPECSYYPDIDMRISRSAHRKHEETDGHLSADDCFSHLDNEVRHSCAKFTTPVYSEM